MGKRGPAPAPTQLKVVRGDRESRINRSEPKPRDGAAAAPGWLSDDARAVWDRLAPDLIKQRVLTDWDVDAFAAFCSAVVVHREAAADVERNGTNITVVDRELSNGTLLFTTRKNPAWQVARESAQLITTLGGRFGLNPSDRASLTMKGDDDSGEAKQPGRLLS